MAILLWSLLSLLTVASGAVPPFQLAAMTFSIGGTLGAASLMLRSGAMHVCWRKSWGLAGAMMPFTSPRHRPMVRGLRLPCVSH